MSVNSNLMKVPPTIASCLFGPTGISPPIRHILSEDSDEEESISSNTKNLDDSAISTQNRENDSTVTSTGGKPLEHNEDDKASSQQQHQQLMNGKPPIQPQQQHKPNETPPHSPLKLDLPTRPSKLQTKTTLSAKTRSSPALENSKSKNEPSSSSTPHVINLQELRRLTAQGIPDAASHRPLAWRILLRYLPLETAEWQSTLDRDRTLYKDLVENLFVFPKDESFEAEGRFLRGMGWKKREKSVKKRKNSASHSRATLTTSTLPIMSPQSVSSVEEVERKLDVLSVKKSASLEGAKSSSSSLEDSPSPISPILTDEERRAHLDKAISAARPKSDVDDRDALVEIEWEKMAKLIPESIQVKWKNSGRDVASLFAGLCANRHTKHSSSGKFLNALLISDTMGVARGDEIVENERQERGGDFTALGTKIDTNLFSQANDNTKSTEIDEQWVQIFENASLLDEIRKDVVRTHPDLLFFLETQDNIGQRRYAALERILFVWAKLNKGVRYVQGMNEIVGTMYFVLANDTNEEWACEAEADTYFLFNTLMVEMRDIFVPDLDEADTGIQGRMSNMIALLSLHDPEVRCHLDDCGIDPGFYSIRWLTTLLSREFYLPDTVRLWDSMFASTHKDNFMRYVCVSMVMIIREDLLKGDFGTCLRLLQKYPPTNIDQLLEASRALWIYESQVTLACHKGGISLTQALTTIAPPPAVIMAYGLSGGMAVDEVERMRQSMAKRSGGRQRSNSIGSTSSSKSAAKAILGLFGGSGRKKQSKRNSSR